MKEMRGENETSNPIFGLVAANVSTFSLTTIEVGRVALNRTMKTGW